MPQLDPEKYKRLGSTKLDPNKYKPAEEEGLLDKYIRGPVREAIGLPRQVPEIKVETPGYGTEPLIPRIGDLGTVGNFAQDTLRGMLSTPEGIMGSSTPSKLPAGAKLKTGNRFGKITTPAANTKIVEEAKKVISNYGDDINKYKTDKELIDAADAINPGFASTLGKAKLDPAKYQSMDMQTTTTSSVPKIANPKPGVADYMNIPKATSAALDLSAPFRQGLGAIGRKEWWTSWKPMVQALKSEDDFVAIQNSIQTNKRFQQANESGLSLGELTTKYEEQFASKIAEKIPGVRASSRAYTTFLNKLRMDMFDNLMDKAEKLGAPIDPKTLAAHINTITGRGSMGLRTGESSKALEKAADALNTIFFSPRMIASRIQVLNPLSYTKMDSFTRKEALRDLATLVSVTGMTSGIAKMMGADINTDPTSPDFAKIKSGDTRVDHMGGFQQYLRLGAQIFDDSLTDREAWKFVEYKFSPALALGKALITGSNAMGQEQGRAESVLRAFTPMILQDAYELYQEDPDIARTLGLTGVAGVGFGVQSYPDNRTGSGMPKIQMPSF